VHSITKANFEGYVTDQNLSLQTYIKWFQKTGFQRATTGTILPVSQVSFSIDWIVKCSHSLFVFCGDKMKLKASDDGLSGATI